MSESRALAPLVLPEDVVLTAVSDLSDTVRASIVAESSDVLVSRVGVRSTSRVISSATADLIQFFEHPTTIVDAVLGYATRTGADPTTVLEESVPVLVNLLNARLLAVDGSQQSESHSAILSVGESFLDMFVEDVIQTQEDVDVYRVRRASELLALKLGRIQSATDRLEREATVLRRLADGAGDWGWSGFEAGHPWLAVTWLEGPTLDRWASSRRAERAWTEIAELCVLVARQYARLHDRGVVHGDVHPRNVIVSTGEDRFGRPSAHATLIDFGASVVDGVMTARHRPAAGHYIEPELAVARLEGVSDPAPTVASDQYAVAVMTYTALTGAHPFDLDLDRTRAMEQIAAGGMVPFRKQGRESWQTVESILSRALATAPADRFPSIEAFADGLAAAIGTGPAARQRVSHTVESFAEATFARYEEEPTEDLLAPNAPLCSVYWGAPGVALSLVYAAGVSSRIGLLEAAIRWMTFARTRRDDPRALRSPALELPSELADSPSLFHGPAGLEFVDAVVALESGQTGELRERLLALDALAARRDAHRADPTLGATSLLWAASHLVDASRDDESVDLTPWLGVGSAVEAIWTDVVRERAPTPGGYLGMAHGEAGICHASLRWLQSNSATDMPDSVTATLDAIAAAADRHGGQASWPVRRGEVGQPWAGWCHGVAGHAQLFALAAAVLPESGDYAQLAIEAAEYVATHPHRNVPHLCCGAAGQAATMLDVHRLTGDDRWLDRAVGLVERAIEHATGPASARGSLFKGDIGIALIAAGVVAGAPAFPVLSA